ncbi:large subunit ribosomal protein L45 [Mytilus galloprovincialis]|uniref:Large ribosomal subunit protein mL45 n=1 Tax=Mytilus galloprovincialis TaxID=29158 RepID=A0A8B6D7S6_MYTGA|nr:large subunit ribosomal protein L45 [Mytilus galloprovincialis]
MAAPMARVFWSSSYAKILNKLRPLNCYGEVCPSALVIQNRSKHWNPKFKKERRQKFMKFELPNYEEQTKGRKEKTSLDEERKKMKKEGRKHPSSFSVKPISISSTSNVLEQYVPPEGDGKTSLISKTVTKDKLSEFGKTGKSYNAIRKIKQFEEHFSSKTFPSEAIEIFKEAQKLIEDVEKNEDRLHELVTEYAYPQMTVGLDTKTMRWNFVDSIEPPRTVHCRTTDLLTKDNLYAQVTVRFHTRQTLAIYDRFGRLTYGSEDLIKDVLEFVVFEKHISDEYASWRIHSKIIPKWIPVRDPLHKTYIKPHMEPIPDEEEDKPEKEAAKA